MKAIFEQGIAGGQATFETEAPSWDAWDKTHLDGHRLVAVQGGEVVGWAALAPVSERCCYEGVAEDSVYVADAAQGRGVGRALLEELIEPAPSATGSGRSRRESSRRTRRRSSCTSAAASASSACASGSATSTASGGTSSSWTTEVDSDQGRGGCDSASASRR